MNKNSRRRPGLCFNCRYWNNIGDPWNDVGFDLGECRLAVEMFDKKQKNNRDILQNADSWSDLFFRPDFGCIHWEEK